MSERSFGEKNLEYYIKEFNIGRFLNEKLLSHIQILHLEAYETLIAEQSIPQYFYLLVEGQIKCAHYHSNGTLAVVQIMHPFSALGDVELINKHRAMTAAVATRPSVVLGIPASIIRDEGMNDPLFLQFISEELVKKLHDSTALRLGHLLPVKSRLALFVVSKPDAADGNILVFPEKEALASMLGTTYRHLNRVLKELMEENTIGPGYPGVRIKNIINLQKLIE